MQVPVDCYESYKPSSHDNRTRHLTRPIGSSCLLQKFSTTFTRHSITSSYTDSDKLNKARKSRFSIVMQNTRNSVHMMPAEKPQVTGLRFTIELSYRILSFIPSENELSRMLGFTTAPANARVSVSGTLPHLIFTPRLLLPHFRKGDLHADQKLDKIAYARLKPTVLKDAILMSSLTLNFLKYSIGGSLENFAVVSLSVETPRRCRILSRDRFSPQIPLLNHSNPGIRVSRSCVQSPALNRRPTASQSNVVH